MTILRPRGFGQQLLEQRLQPLTHLRHGAQVDRQRLHEQRRIQVTLIFGRREHHILIHRQHIALRLGGEVETMHHRRVDGDDHRPPALPQRLVDPGPHFATKEKKYLKQTGVCVPVDMPVVQAAAGFYQLYMNEFGVFRLCLLAVQGELGNLGGDRSGGGWHGWRSGCVSE